MHNNYYFLKHLTATLAPKIENATLIECFSQNKDELILGFDSGGNEVYIKAHLSSSFCCLHFPESFSRARKNSVDLFQHLINKKVIQLRQYVNERCFSLQFENDFDLLFKMHGNRSNIILFSQRSAHQLFKSNLKNDWNLRLENLDRPIEQSKSAFEASGADVKKLFPTFGKLISNYFQSIRFNEKSIDEKWKLIESLLTELEKPDFILLEYEHSLHLSLFNMGTPLQIYQDPIEAINAFFIEYISTQALREYKSQVIAQVDKTIKQSKSYVKKSTGKLLNIENSDSYRQLADLLMANLHSITPGEEKVTVTNFYNNNEPITIKLKATLSPQKNAEVLYRKSKHQGQEIANLQQNIEAKNKLLLEFEKHQKVIQESGDLKSLKSYIKDHSLLGTKNEQQQSFPFNEVDYFGYKILIGKNAKSNDKLLKGYTFKEDLWLHAKDVSGSHVIIKHKAGQGSFPKDIIERAAQLAAYNSKRKTDSLCPVIVTPRKFVRKRKGDPAGAVVVDKEDVILVEPKA